MLKELHNSPCPSRVDKAIIIIGPKLPFSNLSLEHIWNMVKSSFQLNPKMKWKKIHMIWNGGTFSWNWKVPSLNCGSAPLWMKLTGKLPVMVIPAAPMLDHYHPWSKHTLRKLAFDCVCETGIRCNSSFMIQWFIHGLYFWIWYFHIFWVFLAQALD